MGRKKPSTRDDDSATTTQGGGGGGGGKSKKKTFMIDDNEYFMEEPAAVQEEEVAAPVVNRKVKKGNSKKIDANDDDDDEVEETKDEEDDENEAPALKFAGKKKGKAKKGGNDNEFSASSFDLLGEGDDEDNDDEDEPVISFSGKKKPAKSKKNDGSVFSAASFDGLDEGEEDEDQDKHERFEEEDKDAMEITFAGKKKKSSKGLKKSAGNSFGAALLDEEIDEDTVSKPDGNLVGGDTVDEGEDVSVIKFSGKKKSSKKKNNIINSVLETGIGDEASDVIEPDEHSVSIGGKEAEDSKSKKQTIEGVAETSKNKKKKKKGGRTAQEEEDLDKILAELGEALPLPKSSPTLPEASAGLPPDEKVQSQPQMEDGASEKEAEEEGPVESAAAKKKKKKKEKEKEKKAAAAAVAAPAVEDKKDETKGKALDKKVPKHVREMQERLAKHNEAVERKKREEEEKLRKEEEERRQQEELERLAEEKKRLKKEREKEKLLKKKQDGKLLTGKQKEEVRRLEAMRKQILANAGLQLAAGDTAGAPGKRPLYQKKKSKPHAQANGAAPGEGAECLEIKEIQQETIGKELVEEAGKVEEVESELTEKFEKLDLMNIEEKGELTDDVENGVDEEDDDEEWDAKSWDDADLKLPGKNAFADEEVDSEPESLGKKEIKSAQDAAKPVLTTQKTTSVLPHKSQNAESKKDDPETEGIDKSKRKVKKEAKSDVPSLSEKSLRSPICCIMGHVDTGKTKLLDCIRGTNVQEGEAGGITQQIGATYFPADNIRDRTKELKADAKLNVPGLLVIDTPGHESFTNLRSRGSGLCDIAILVVDIMHGLEPQTIESLNLLKMRNTEFIVALNKVDRLYGWKTCRNAPIVKAMKQQSKDVQIEFNMRLTQVVTQFKEQGINTELYYKNKEMGETFSIVPTSAISGEGIPDLLLLLVQWAQKTMVEKLTYSNEVQCTVLEVKVIEGHGTTIDVVLVNGVLHEGDQIVICGMQGPIVTTIRALLTPHPMKELRVKGTYLHYKEIKAAQGVKITGQGLDHAIAGTALYVVGPDDDLEDIKEAAMEDMRSVMSRIDKSGEGVYVQASTLGSLEALLEFLKTPEVKIPVSGIGIGPVHKKDVMKASVMLEKKKEYATILAFDVKVTPEARDLADELGVKIFIADIIYHLFDQFKAYIDNLKEEKKRESAEDAVFPCVLKIMPNCIFNKKDPIVLGVDVLEGIVKVGTPICVPQKDFIDIGRIASVENNHKPVDYAKKGQKVAIKIVGSSSEEQQKMFGRHFELEDELVSRISRTSIDILKANYRDDLSNEEWRLLVKLKTLFKIQ
ncbi:eukaryotic translation initiation factor 2 (eIF-2) family protein [Abeliophyllum distichum]|uniref:Eukaryotic translation initiation factor 5B n=1 Tax=Abeliophyllum distichum TaxID=126358 RepID=A0ABD1SB29_9LAMI